MRMDAVPLEEGRLEGLDLENYPWLHERHRIFPAVLKNETYGKILDVAGGIGVVAKRIRDGYPCFMLTNEISRTGQKSLKKNRLPSISFDLDDPGLHFPFSEGSFDAVISLATLEHIIHLDHHMQEIRRILKTGGHLYLSVPNYSSIHFAVPYLLKGKSFHDPMKGGIDKYEFYAHVRYFTYKTLLEFVGSFGFRPKAVYLPLPHGSSRFLTLKKRSKLLALTFRAAMSAMYLCLSPRWAFHPVVCFTKIDPPAGTFFGKPKKIIL